MRKSCAAKAVSCEGFAKAPVTGCIAMLAVAAVLAAAASRSGHGSGSSSLREALLESRNIWPLELYALRESYERLCNTGHLAGVYNETYDRKKSPTHAFRPSTTTLTSSRRPPRVVASVSLCHSSSRSSTQAEAEASCGAGHRGLEEPADDGRRGERRQEDRGPLPGLSGAPRASTRSALPT